MVQKHRTAHKATFAKDVSPMRNMSVNKHEHSSNPASSVSLGFSSRLSVPAAAAGGSSSNSNAAANNDKWKYNNMINNERGQFNNLHFF